MMRMPFFAVFLSLAFLASLSGCGKEDSSPEKRASIKLKDSVVAKKQAPQIKPPEPEKKEAKYVYEAAGRRDPFLALMDIRKPVLDSGQPLTPLQKFDLGQFRLIGVIVGRNEPMAMVMAPGGKAYVLKRGVKIGKNAGKVVDIRADAVLIEERFYDFAGEYRTNVQEIQLPKRQGV